MKVQSCSMRKKQRWLKSSLEITFSPQKSLLNRAGFLFLAGATGLEPATSGVTGRRSNQLNYAPNSCLEFQIVDFRFKLAIPNSASRNRMVGGTGIEPVTSGL